MPKSTKIGEQFKKLGVKHVITFDFEGFEWDVDEHDSLLTYRYNYIYSFCAHFYTRLIDECTVLDAFTFAKEYVTGDKVHLYEEIYQSKDTRHYSLGIEPILLPKGIDNHNNKRLFYKLADENESIYLRSGELHDISKARCQNTNITKPKDAFIGHHIELHKALKYLTCSDDQKRYLVHVQGKRFVGKTRFLNEVAYRLLARSLFEYKIMYRDMQEI